jgi:hypothetical protein
MANIVLSVAGAPPLKYRKIDPEPEAWDSQWSIYERWIQRLRDEAGMDGSWLLSATTIRGLAVKMRVKPMCGGHDVMTSELKNVLDRVMKAGLDFPGNAIEVYICDGLTGSIGLCCKHTVMETPRAVLLLGESTGRARNGVRVLAHDYAGYGEDLDLFGSDHPLNAKKYVRACILHELGHILHSWKSPQHYAACVDAAALAGLTQDQIAADRLYRDKLARFSPGLPGVQAASIAVRAAGARISDRAGENLQEYVAESFTAQSLRLNRPQGADALYFNLGGVDGTAIRF